MTRLYPEERYDEELLTVQHGFEQLLPIAAPIHRLDVAVLGRAANQIDDRKHFCVFTTEQHLRNELLQR